MDDYKMKITGIEIGEYRQFKNIKFDFAYPADHEKAGQPLEKVCFIGQSGTGKTTLLNIVFDFFQVVSAGAHIIKTAEFNSSLAPFNTFKNEIILRIELNNKHVIFSGDSLRDQPVGSAFIGWAYSNGITEDVKAYDRVLLIYKRFYF